MERLTPEQRQFAEEQHDLVLRYLGFHCLDPDEFYSVAVDGYLRAVQLYLEKERLRKYKFSTIAYRCMYCDIGHYFRSLKRPMRNAPTVSLDAPAYRETTQVSWHEIVGADEQDVSDAAIDRDIERQYMERLTPLQRRIAGLCVQGYPHKQVAGMCDISLARLYRNLDKMRVTLCRTLPDNAA